MKTFEQWRNEHAYVEVYEAQTCAQTYSVRSTDESLWDLKDYRVFNVTELVTVLTRIPDRPEKKLTFHEWYAQEGIRGCRTYYTENRRAHILFSSNTVLPPLDLLDYETMAVSGFNAVLAQL